MRKPMPFNREPTVSLKDQMIVVVQEGIVVPSSKKYNLKYDSPNKFQAIKEAEYPHVFQINKKDLKDMV